MRRRVSRSRDHHGPRLDRLRPAVLREANLVSRRPAAALAVTAFTRAPRRTLSPSFAAMVRVSMAMP